MPHELTLEMGGAGGEFSPPLEAPQGAGHQLTAAAVPLEITSTGRRCETGAEPQVSRSRSPGRRGTISVLPRPRPPLVRSPHGDDEDPQRPAVRRHRPWYRSAADQGPELRDALHGLAVGRRR